MVLHRVGAVERRQVEDVDEQPRALDVGEELVPEAGAVARALDQPGDVGDDELAVVRLERAEDRLEGRERDSRRPSACARVMRASSEDLPAFGSPTRPDVGEQLELQLDHALLARQAALGEPRRLARRGR